MIAPGKPGAKAGFSVDRGREAFHCLAAMTAKHLCRRSWIFLVRLQREVAYDDCMGMAAQIAYYMLLSTFPFLIFLMSLVSYLPIGKALEPLILDGLREQMPLEAANFVVDAVMGILPTRSQGITALGFLLALWSGSMAVGAMITTFNRAYNLRPRRNMLYQKLLAISLTLALSALFLLSLLIVLFGPQLTQQIFESLHMASQTNTIWTSLRLPIAAILAFVGLGILYYYAPEAKQRVIHILPGTVAASVMWLSASSLFRLFVRNFGNYNATYGSLAALVILMLWFWLTGFIFLLGAEINAQMKRMEHEIGHYPIRLLR